MYVHNSVLGLLLKLHCTTLELIEASFPPNGLTRVVVGGALSHKAALSTISNFQNITVLNIPELRNGHKEAEDKAKRQQAETIITSLRCCQIPEENDHHAISNTYLRPR